MLEALLLHVNGDVDEHRAGPAGGGDVEGLLDHPGDVVGVLDQIAVLGEGGHRAGDVHLLEDVPAQQIAGDLARDGHHGDGIQIGGGNAGDQVGGSRARGHHAHPRSAADTGIAGCRVSRVLFRPDQGIADLRVGLQGVHRRADRCPGISENVLHLLLQQAFDQRFRSSHASVTSA